MNLQDKTPEELNHELRIAAEALEKYGNWDLLEAVSLEYDRRLKALEAMTEKAEEWRRGTYLMDKNDTPRAVSERVKVAKSILAAAKESEGKLATWNSLHCAGREPSADDYSD